MAYLGNSGDQASTAGSAGSFPIARGFAITALIALVILALLRKVFGSISVSGSI